MIINSASDFQVQKGQTMTVKFSGYTGGKMSVDKISPTTKNAVVEAVSAPAKAKKRRSRHYRNVRLFDVINDVATETGFSVFYYENIVNWFYENVSRWNETPLSFLNRLCTREGYGLKVDDYRIIIYDKDTAEAKDSVLTITQADTIDNIVKFQDVSCVTESVRIVYFDVNTGYKIEYAAGIEEAGEQTVITEYVKDVSEAERFSRGYLRDKNKYCTTAIALIPINTEIAATSNITFEGFGRYDGKYSIEEVTHCPITEQTKISARKIS
jgi:phage protein D